MDEIEEVVENLMHNEIDFLDLSFEFAQQAPFTPLLYHQRLPDFSDQDFETILDVLMEALQENVSVQRVHMDWSFLRLLRPVEQAVLMERIGSLSLLQELQITGSTAKPDQQHLSVTSFIGFLNACANRRNRNDTITTDDGRTLRTITTPTSLRKLTLDGMGSLRIPDWDSLEEFSRLIATTEAIHSSLQVFRLENLVLPDEPTQPVLESLTAALCVCRGLTEIHIAVNLPRHYRRIRQELVSRQTLSGLQSSSRITTIRLHNWGLQPLHAMTLLRLGPQLVTLDLLHNPPLLRKNEHAIGSARDYCNILRNHRQSGGIHRFLGINDERVECYLFLNRCGRFDAAESSSWTATFEYWATVARRERQELGSELDALYMAIREAPPIFLRSTT